MTESSSAEILIRVDANGEIGTGHLMRCLALAQGHVDGGGTVLFAVSNETDRFVERLSPEGIGLARIPYPVGSQDDARNVIELASRKRTKWVVIDGYRFGEAYQDALREAGFKVLVIDDYGQCSHYVADIVVNQNLHGNENLYRSREGYTRLLLGVMYVLLRREFLNCPRQKKHMRPNERNLLITTGGGSWPQLTSDIVKTVLDLRKDLYLLVISDRLDDTDFAECREESKGKVRVVKRIDDMASAMAWADIAVSAAGSTSWELCFMGVPTILFTLAANQEEIARGLDLSGAAINLGWAGSHAMSLLTDSLDRLLSSPETRNAMSERGQKLVDGRGARRVLEVMGVTPGFTGP